MMKVLHITNWYPNPYHSVEGIFVKEQFELFRTVTDARLVNVQVKNGSRLFQYRKIVYSEREKGYYILTRIKYQFVIEILTTFLLLFVLRKERTKQYALLHFHIAYPLLVHFRRWRSFFKQRILVSEHWSAYHYNFYLPAGSKKLNRIKKIFSYGIPIITVSQSLATDIKIFAGSFSFPTHILPNVIDHSLFYYREKQKQDIPVFFIVNVWTKIKNPFPLLEGFKLLNESGRPFKLVIGGFGDLIPDIERFVQEHNLGGTIIFKGKMSKAEIAAQLRESDAYLFSSMYETFSVACAQALCCGVPLIGPPLPAIMEYAGNDSLLKVEDPTAKGWFHAIEFFLNNIQSYKREKIAQQIQSRFSHEQFIYQYRQIISSLP